MTAMLLPKCDQLPTSLVAALGTDDFQFLTVEDGEVIPEKAAEGDVVTAVKPELLPFEPRRSLPERFGVLILLLFQTCHGLPPIKKGPPV
jgi:hypothetical protein